MQVHERLRLYIFSHHLKQVSIAKAAGINISTFNAILNGKRKLYVDELETICRVLEVGPENFIKLK